jgi:nucleoside-diphosphate-sugar epimerase
MSLYLVTGGAGFIGSHIVEELVRRGERVRVLDNLSTGRRENLAQVSSRIEMIEGDIRDADSTRRAMDGVDYALHEAAIVSVPQSMDDPVTTHDVNVTGTLNVMMAAREARVKRVVLASSCAVYGDNDSLPLNEAEKPRLLSPYAASKLTGELYSETFLAAYGLPTVALRYFNTFGSRQNPKGDYAAVIPRFMTRMRTGQPPVIYGDGEQTRDFVHVSDVVRANLLVCERPEAVGQVLNVASAQRTSLLELVRTLNDLLSTRLTPEFQRERPGDIRHSAGDGAKMAAVLGFRVETPLSAGLSRMIIEKSS